MSDIPFLSKIKKSKPQIRACKQYFKDSIIEMFLYGNLNLNQANYYPRSDQ